MAAGDTGLTAPVQLRHQLDACGDDTAARLGILGDYLHNQVVLTEQVLRTMAVELDRHVENTRDIEELRDTLGRSLHDSGVPITKIAALARRTDSYMGRRLRRRGLLGLSKAGAHHRRGGATPA